MASLFNLRVGLDNDSFVHNPMTELARILREIAEKLEDGSGVADYRTVRDENGNPVGEYTLS